MVLKAGKCFGRPLCTDRGVTQGYPFSPTIFNIVVDAVVRVVLLEVCGYQVAQHGIGWLAGEHDICFYVDDRRIAGRYPLWVHTTLTEMVKMFERVRQQKNLGKTKVMACTPGFIWGQ